MSSTTKYEKLLTLLKQLGIRTITDNLDQALSGFPLVLPLTGGQSICLELPQPSLLSTLDPNSVGVAILDHYGYAVNTWGLAERIEFFNGKISCLDTEIVGLVEAAYRGTPGSLYLDGHRYYVSAVNSHDVVWLFVLVTNAHEEREARKLASRSARSADALKRVGKALTMHQTLAPLCVSAVHEIASTCELAAVLLWVRNADEKNLELIASVGANRHGTALLATIDGTDGYSCVAELVAAKRKPFSLENVDENAMTFELESKFCYLKPGGMMVLPLTIGDRLIGVLELIGRDGDTAFFENKDLFGTIAEHLSLALNSASMFESVERLAWFDPLTGIANHRSMQDFLHRRITEAERTAQDVGLLMLDVDHFRSFNEEEGHDAGDEVLKRVVEVLKQTVRPYDMAARYGGEEFTIILPGLDEEGTMNVGERIRTRIQEIEFITRSGRIRHVSASLGGAVYPQSATDPANLLKAADVALFKAKRAGRNRVMFYEGLYQDEQSEPILEMERIESWLTEPDKEDAAALHQAVSPFLPHLSSELALSKTQEQILQALIKLAPMYLKSLAEQNDDLIHAMEKSPDLRPVMPSLIALPERFDGQGPLNMQGQMIPLLARVMKILIALASNQGTLTSDVGSFDPEILALISEAEEAA